MNFNSFFVKILKLLIIIMFIILIYYIYLLIININILSVTNFNKNLLIQSYSQELNNYKINYENINYLLNKKTKWNYTIDILKSFT